MMKLLSSVLLVAAIALTIMCSAALGVNATSLQHLRHHLSKKNASFRAAIGAPAPATVGISANLFNEISAAVVPIINTMAQNIVIPGESSSHFDFSDIHIENFHLGTINFDFSEVSGAVQASVQITQLSLSIPQTSFEVKDKILFAHIHCSGHFWASVNAHAAISLAISEDSFGKLVAISRSSTLGFDEFSVSHKMNNFFCKIADKIASLLVNIQKIIKSAIEKIAPKIGSAIADALSGAFAKLPFSVTAPPTASAEHVYLPIDLDSFVKEQQHTQPQQQPLVLKKKNNNDKNAAALDLSISIPATSLNTVLQTLKGLGKLVFSSSHIKGLTTTSLRAFIPDAYTLCPGCDLSVSTNVATGSSCPSVQFAPNNASLAVPQMTMSVGAVQNGTTTIIPLFTVLGSGSFSVSGFQIASNATAEVLHFDIGVNSLSLTPGDSQVGKLGSLIWLIQIFVQTLVPQFNKYLYIPLPSTGLGSVADLQVNVTSTAFVAGVNINM